MALFVLFFYCLKLLSLRPKDRGKKKEAKDEREEIYWEY